LNYYCGVGATSSTASSCPLHSVTLTTGSSSITQCLCVSGYEPIGGDINNGCQPCNMGMYKATISNAMCSACAVNSTTTATGSTSCVCDQGYYGTWSIATNTGCNACPLSTYKPDIGNSVTCTLCPDYSHTSSVASLVITSCICNNGFNGTAGGPCDDINECLTNNGGCDAAECFNYPGGHSCGTCVFGTTEYHVGYNAECIVISPVVDTLTLVEYNDTYDAYGQLLLPTVNSGTRITFNTTGNYTLVDGTEDESTYDASSLLLTYGTDDQPDQYQCVIATQTITEEALLSTIDCILSGGVGNYLYFSMWLWNITGAEFEQLSPSSSVDLFAYPQPTIVPRTLRRSGTTTATGSTLLIAATNYASESIAFDVTNMLYDDALLVNYGPSTAPLAYTCTVLTALSTPSTLVCLTQSQAGTDTTVAFDMHFTVTVDNTVSLRGTDVYQFPVVPDLLAVWGCDNDVYPTIDNATTNCPTQGGVTLTMLGNGFINIQSVYINSVLCTNLQTNSTFDPTIYLGSYMITCVLPAGSGADQPIVISANQQFSSTKRLLSYASPSVTSLVGCTQLANGNIGTCDRLGDQPITIL
jgi:hypothetical protein